MNAIESSPANAGSSFTGLIAALETWTARHALLSVAIILTLSAFPLLFVINAPVHGDVQLYQNVASDTLSGKLPYRDRVVEYPPYALPLFAVPAFFGAASYQQTFAVLVVMGDAAIKCLLLLFGLRSNSRRTLLPLFLYCAAIPFIRYFYLQRYDIFPALLTVLVIWAFCSRRYFLSGALVAVATGVKLYPILLAPPLFFLARQHKMKFSLGFCAGVLPIALLSLFLPWWQFLLFHSARGLQVESLYASIVWLGHLLGFNDAQWAQARAWVEVRGQAAATILPATRLLFLGTVAASVGFSCWATRGIQTITAPVLARILLLPVLAFVAFNQVLSPQYLIWLLPLAALAALEGDSKAGWAMVLATSLTPIFYPSPEYGSGLGLSQTLLLLGRNLLLILIWAGLLWQLLRTARRADGPPVEPGVQPEVPGRHQQDGQQV